MDARAIRGVARHGPGRPDPVAGAPLIVPPEMTSAKTSLFVTLTDAVRRGTQALITQQRPDGAWEGEVVWNSMLLAQYVIVRRIVGRWPIAEVDRDAMLRYFARTSRPDGSFGMHPDSAGYLFFTTLAYVAMRLLGLGPTAPVAQRAMSWIR